MVGAWQRCRNEGAEGAEGAEGVKLKGLCLLLDAEHMSWFCLCAFPSRLGSRLVQVNCLCVCLRMCLCLRLCR